MEWTKEQQQAIYEKGRNILVAAAAGSGKTAVLVERIINKIINEQVDIDQLLVVTFTNAAAAEMRERVLNAELKTRPKILTDNETIKEKEISKNKKVIDIANKKIIKKNLIKKPKGKEEILEEVINLKGISKTKEIPDQIKSIYPIKKLSNISTMDSNYFIINDKKTIIITKENRKNCYYRRGGG